ncbi:hypothetical protein F1640_20410 [Novosphingobium sp. NBM11]|uniref:ParB N-terminal domain-containing protein n=1 Tax=Novosphingobium sp. NBM11 TaxID=2596914 RepID=UPI0018922B42|nr:ParB N-terminal domain-containing protein [Novosphingobium sp. NBM11]MBF5092286.1 hypothetical protein [Novosphingobium sp. NBM11]
MAVAEHLEASERFPSRVPQREPAVSDQRSSWRARHRPRSPRPSRPTSGKAELLAISRRGGWKASRGRPNGEATGHPAEASECSIWPGNARDYALLTEDRVRSLIDSIQAENGNRIPVVVRRVKNAALEYELVIGTRAPLGPSRAQREPLSDIELVAIIEDLDDEAAFRLADIENREREDISDLERGANYKAAVDAIMMACRPAWRTVCEALEIHVVEVHRSHGKSRNRS